MARPNDTIRWVVPAARQAGYLIHTTFDTQDEAPFKAYCSKILRSGEIVDQIGAEPEHNLCSSCYRGAYVQERRVEELASRERFVIRVVTDDGEPEKCPTCGSHVGWLRFPDSPRYYLVQGGPRVASAPELRASRRSQVHPAPDLRW